MASCNGPNCVKHFSGWPSLPKKFFRGTFDPQFIPFSFNLCLGPLAGNTSHPILLIGNTAGRQLVLPFYTSS